jgi:uncharacterized protein DUF1553/uncharacterized protein DUF1549/cytochrome c
MGRFRLCAWIVLLWGEACPCFAGDEKGLPERAVEVLKVECLRCHRGSQAKGGLDLTARESALRGGQSGPVLVAGRPDESRLIRAVRREVDPPMPPRKTLPPETVEVLRQWVERGIEWPAPPAAERPAAAPPATPVAPGAPWWRDPVRRPLLPEVKAAEWIRSPVDAFVLARLEARGLSPAPPAGRRELLRRAYFDLLGLPPDPREVDRFLADESPDAWERLIDRLLASPRYGERWGRHWLDLVRYAETSGYERDGPKPNAWRYRDYVIDAFNADMPYDRFVTEQLAGDEIDGATGDSLIATGFYRLGPEDDEPDDKEQARFDELDDVVRTASGAFLGLTIGCARCHDHKFDPIPQVDYYRLLAHFSGIKYSDEVPLAPAPVVEGFRAAKAAVEAKVKGIEGEIAGLLAATRDRLFAEKLALLEPRLRDAYRAPAAGRSEEEKKLAEEAAKQAAPSPEEIARRLPPEAKAREKELRAKIEEVKRSLPPRYPEALGITEEGAPPKAHVLIRGNARQLGPEVEPGFPSVLASARRSRAAGPAARPVKKPVASGRRLDLARWIVDPQNPLATRVWVNRVWEHHFGRGIVRSPSDFGTMGDPPTHPEILDWLAAELVEQGFQLKPLHRLIMTSSAYRMSSALDPRAQEADPANDLFWRRDLRRLEAEAVRDSILAVSGRLNLKMGGPSVFPPVSKEVLHGQSRPGEGWTTSPPEEAARRSIYVFVKRSVPLPLLEAFDAADTGQTCARRNVTTIAPQALTLLNGEFVQEESRSFAERLRKEVGEEPARQVERAYRLALARPPSASEMETALGFLARQAERARKPGAGAPPSEIDAARRALESFCLVVLNLNEFVYVD